mmetsp:Transcript_14685/g.43480  ORF Transcript_14685/g.43480 Transcript_14685/m.43480 type:complete len:248 (-) Transcript_14685:239-982(-)
MGLQRSHVVITCSLTDLVHHLSLSLSPQQIYAALEGSSGLELGSRVEPSRSSGGGDGARSGCKRGGGSARARTKGWSGTCTLRPALRLPQSGLPVSRYRGKRRDRVRSLLREIPRGFLGEVGLEEDPRTPEYRRPKGQVHREPAEHAVQLVHCLGPLSFQHRAPRCGSFRKPGILALAQVSVSILLKGAARMVLERPAKILEASPSAAGCSRLAQGLPEQGETSTTPRQGGLLQPSRQKRPIHQHPE